jgi:hypothetical protein
MNKAGCVYRRDVKALLTFFTAANPVSGLFRQASPNFARKSIQRPLP